MVRLVIVLFICFICGLSGAATLNLPPRQSDAMTGSQFHNHVLNMTRVQREDAIWEQVQAGNVPDFLRQLKPITVSMTINGVPRTATYHVTPDYFAIGSDSDYFRVPMGAPLAQQIADFAGCNLPTRKMVNDIYAQADKKIAPFPYSPSTYNITSVQVMWLSNEKIDSQLLSAGAMLGQLVAGTKKDVVVTDELDNRPAPPRVAIYGWHQLNGAPIQPLSLVHENTYADYSHGVRLVLNEVLVGGTQTMTVGEVIQSSVYTKLLNDEANTYTTWRYPVPLTPTPTPTATPTPTLSPTPAPPSVELISNGSFENFPSASGAAPGWSSWTTGPNGVIFGRAGVNRYDGAYSQYWSRSDTVPFDGGVYQAVSTTPGRNYRLKGWIKRQSTMAGTSMAIGYDLTGGQQGDGTSVNYSPVIAPNNTWAAFEITFTATGSSTTIFARGGHAGTTGGTNCLFYVDVVSVKEE